MKVACESCSIAVDQVLNLNPNKADAGKGSNRSVSDAASITQHSQVEKARQSNSELAGSLRSDAESNKYIEGLMTSFKSENTFRNRMNSLVEVLAQEVSATDKYTDALRTQARAKKRVMQNQHVEIMETSEEYLKKAREDMDETAAAPENEGARSDQATESNDPQDAQGPEIEDAPLGEAPVVVGESVDTLV